MFVLFLINRNRNICRHQLRVMSFRRLVFAFYIYRSISDTILFSMHLFTDQFEPKGKHKNKYTPLRPTQSQIVSSVQLQNQNWVVFLLSGPRSESQVFLLMVLGPLAFNGSVRTRNEPWDRFWSGPHAPTKLSEHNPQKLLRQWRHTTSFSLSTPRYKRYNIT